MEGREECTKKVRRLPCSKPGRWANLHYPLEVTIQGTFLVVSWKKWEMLLLSPASAQQTCWGSVGTYQTTWKGKSPLKSSKGSERREIPKKRKVLRKKENRHLKKNPKDSEVPYQQEVTLPTPRTKIPTKEKHQRTKSVHKIFAFRWERYRFPIWFLVVPIKTVEANRYSKEKGGTSDS